MANARLYALDVDRIPRLDGKTREYIRGLKGQARIVFDDLNANRQPRLAQDICKSCAGQIQTRQDVFRVVLYYILIFKKKGVVKATLPIFEDENEKSVFAGLFDSDGNLNPTDSENE